MARLLGGLEQLERQIAGTGAHLEDHVGRLDRRLLHHCGGHQGVLKQVLAQRVLQLDPNVPVVGRARGCGGATTAPVSSLHFHLLWHDWRPSIDEGERVDGGPGRGHADELFSERTVVAGERGSGGAGAAHQHCSGWPV